MILKEQKEKIKHCEEQFSISLQEKLQILNEQLAYARENSSFYSYLPEKALTSLEKLKEIPEISCADLIAHADEMTCTAPWNIKRMVTLMTSGSTAPPKRLAFSEKDIEATVAFFHHGMHTLCDRGDTVGIFMPGTNPDGLCDILSRAIRRFGAIPKVYGIIQDFENAAAFLKENKPAVLVGFPVQIRQLALIYPDFRPTCVLLSADYCAESVIGTIERTWQCRAYVHYGITESGLGCAVETPSGEGMIPRKDVLLEVNERGEILLTTLTREALPLIRYNTGDLGILREDGHLLRVLGRRQEREGRVSITTLDEILFRHDWILNYAAALDGRVLKISINDMVQKQKELDSGNQSTDDDLREKLDLHCRIIEKELESVLKGGDLKRNNSVDAKTALNKTCIKNSDSRELFLEISFVSEIAFTGKRSIC